MRLHIGTRDYPADLSLDVFAGDGLSGVMGLMTLSLVPDLLNILPLYVILLAFTPLAMAVSRISPLLVFAASAGLWSQVQATGLNLPAGGAPGRTWFFDPFAWQLMFFTGFAFGMRWLPKPRFNHPALLPIAAVAVAVSVPINFWAFTNNIPELLSVRDWLIPDGVVATTRLDFPRYAHFLCLAYVVLNLVDRYPKIATAPVLAPVVAIGRQSLPTFVSSVAIAWMAGMLLDVVGRDSVSVAAINLLGFSAIFAIARLAAWFKSAPWLPGAEQAAPRRAGALTPTLLARAAALVAQVRRDPPTQSADA